MAEEGKKLWENTAVGYFLGKKLSFMAIKSYVFSIWKGLKEVKATSNGFFFFKFDSYASRTNVIEGGPWLYGGQPLFLERWKEGMTLEKRNHKSVPIWVKFKNIPTEYWTMDGLSTVASAVGRPLYTDAITSSMARLDYARVCVIVDIESKFIDHMFMLLPSKNGEYNGSCKVLLEYEWKPTICSSCKSFGHKDVECPLVAKSAQRSKQVHIYVPKSKPKDNEWEVVKRKKGTGVVENERELVKAGDRVNDIPESSNAFALLEHIDIEESDRVDVEEDRVRRDDRVRIGGVTIGDDDGANDLHDTNDLFRDVERECADLRGPIAAPGECVK